MGFLGSKKSKERLRIVIDVGSDSTKAVVFVVPERGSLPVVQNKLVIKIPSTLSSIQKISRLHEFLFNTIKELGAVPEKITIALGPSIAEHAIATWKKKATPNQKPLDRKELSEIFQSMLEEHEDPRRTVIAAPIELMANGYSVRLVLPQKIPASELEFRTALLYMSGVMGIALGEIKKSLGGMPIGFTTLAMAYQEAITRALDVRDTLLIDIGGDETAIILLKDGILAEFAYVPAGANNFTRRIASDANIPLTEAAAVQAQYAAQLMTRPKATTIQTAIAKEINPWTNLFLNALDALYYTGPLPENVFLFGGGANLPELQAVIANGEWMLNRSYTTTPKVRMLNASDLFGKNSLQGFLQGPEEVGLASLIFYSLYHEPIF